MSERRCALLLFGCVLLMALCGCLRSRDSCAAVELLVQYPTGLSFSPDVTLVNLEFRYDIKSTAAMVTVRGHKLSIPFETLHVRGCSVILLQVLQLSRPRIASALFGSCCLLACGLAD